MSGTRIDRCRIAAGRARVTVPVARMVGLCAKAAPS